MAMSDLETSRDGTADALGKLIRHALKVAMVARGLSEDGLAIFLTWFATQHPYAAAAIALVFLAIIILLIRWVVKALRALFRGAEGELMHSARV